MKWPQNTNPEQNATRHVNLRYTYKNKIVHKFGEWHIQTKWMVLITKKDTICFTISEGLWRSMILLWILIWYLSQVLEPSPQGVFRVVIRKIFVGIRTGPFTFSCLSLAPLIRSAHTVNITICIVLFFFIIWGKVFKHSLNVKIKYSRDQLTLIYAPQTTKYQPKHDT